jgi:chromosome segregation ATPase
VSGLFQRALELIRRDPLPPAWEGIVFDEESGISPEDQKEIIAALDKVVRESRIAVTPEVLKIQARKRGTLFPLLVNVSSIVLLVGVGLTFYLLFQRDETGLRGEVAVLATAEGRLIQELKKESEAQLLEKSREISQIQDRMQAIDRERQDLQSNMDARISTREAELRRALEAELAAEREKLQRLGIAEADISLRIQELEKRKTDQYQQELAGFRRQAAEERRKAEASLAALREEYQANLAQANQERAKVLEEARRREEDLRSQLDARTRALEQETQAARQELGRVAEQREKEDLTAGQLVGFYTQVKGHIAGSRFDQALAGLATIREYLNDPKIAALPGMLRRRDVELFVVDSLASLVHGEMRREVEAEADTASLIAAAGSVTEMRSRVLQADELYRQGQVDSAERLYRDALALIPEVGRAHEYFLARLRRSIEEKDDEIAALRGELDSRTGEADELRRTAGELRQTSDELRQALQDKPREAAALQAELARVKDEAGSTRRSLEERLGRLQEELAGRVALIDTLQREKRSLEAQIASLREGMREMERAQAERDARAAQALQAAQDAQAAQAARDRQESDSGQRLQELADQVERLEQVEARYNRLLGSYQSYVVREDALLSARGSPALIESKLHLNAFLSSTEEAFPGLWKRIKRYDEAFQQAGRAGAMKEIADILYELSYLDQPEARARFLEAEARRYPDDPLMRQFLDDLKDLPAGGSG